MVRLERQRSQVVGMLRALADGRILKQKPLGFLIAPLHLGKHAAPNRPPAAVRRLPHRLARRWPHGAAPLSTPGPAGPGAVPLAMPPGPRSRPPVRLSPSPLGP